MISRIAIVRFIVYGAVLILAALVWLTRHPQALAYIGVPVQQAEQWPFLGATVQRALTEEISVADLRRQLNSAPDNLFIVDVRTPEEYRLGHVESALLLPLAELEAGTGLGTIKLLLQGRQLVVYCASGPRAYAALSMLRRDGIAGRNLTGGYQAWLEALQNS